jgi:hypothetical protein
LVLWTTGLTLFGGLVVYLVLYEMLQHLYVRKLASPSKLKEEVVMCGMEYERDELTAPVSRVFSMIMSKAFPRGHRGTIQLAGSIILNDWFSWMLITLAVILLIAVFAGW